MLLCCKGIQRITELTLISCRSQWHAGNLYNIVTFMHNLIFTEASAIEGPQNHMVPGANSYKRQKTGSKLHDFEICVSQKLIDIHLGSVLK